MKLFRLFQKSQSSKTQHISCCELTEFDCNQGRNCPLRTQHSSLQAKNAPLNGTSNTQPVQKSQAEPGDKTLTRPYRSSNRTMSSSPK